MDEENDQTDEASKGFSLFSYDDKVVNLECGRCGKVFSFKRGLFSSVSEDECIPKVDLSCPNCLKADNASIKVKPTGVSSSSVVGQSAASSSPSKGSSSENAAGAGCIFFLIALVAFVVGFACSMASAFLVSVVFMVIALVFLVAGFISMGVSSALETPEEKERSKAQTEAMVNRDKYNGLKYTCPMCGSHKIKSIGTAKKLGGAVMVGLASGNIGKNYQCDDCNYRW